MVQNTNTVDRIMNLIKECKLHELVLLLGLGLGWLHIATLDPQYVCHLPRYPSHVPV